MKPWLHWLAVLCCLCAAVSARGETDRTGEPLVLRTEAMQVPLAGHIWQWHDERGDRAFEQVIADQSLPFERLPGSFFAGVSRQGAFWLKVPFTVAEQQAPDWLALNAPWIEHLDVYITARDGDAALWQRHTGLTQPVSSRDLDVSAIALHAPLPPGDYTLWIRAAGARALTLDGAFWQLNAFTETHMREQGLMLNLAGMMLVMAGIGLLIGSLIRDSSLLWYGVYVSGSVVTGLGLTGIMGALILPNAPELGARLTAVAVCVTILGATRVALRIFSLVRYMPVTAFVLNMLGNLMAVCALFAATGYYHLVVGVVNATALVSCVIGTWAAFRVVRRHYTPDVVLYFVGMLFYGLPQMFIQLRYLGVYDGPFVGTMAQEIMRTGHVFLVLLGMAVKLTELQRAERETEQRRLRMASDMQASLEKQVAERTRELNSELQARRVVEKQLSDTLREQRSFLAMVSHEFRTPLTVINLVSYNIGHRHADNHETREDVARVERANQRLVGLVDACLSNEWLDNATMQVNCSLRDLSPMLVELCEQRRIVAGREIELKLPAGPVFVHIDAALVQVVFDNLIGNAIKYSPAGSPLAVEVRRFSSGAVEVSVTDRGPGIAPGERTRVFERYYRSPTVLSHTGIGLGLHIVRRIVSLHGGDVWVDGSYTAGARFVVRFPAPSSFEPVSQPLH